MASRHTDRILVVVPAQHDGSIAVIAEDGEEVEVPIPASVLPGETFEVVLLASSTSSDEDTHTNTLLHTEAPLALSSAGGRSGSKLRRLALENSMLSAAVQLYEQRVIEREACHSLAMEALHAQLEDQPTVAAQEQSTPPQATLQQAREKVAEAQGEAARLRARLADVGNEVETNRARADRCLAVVRKLQVCACARARARVCVCVTLSAPLSACRCAWTRCACVPLNTAWSLATHGRRNRRPPEQPLRRC